MVPRVLLWVPGNAARALALWVCALAAWAADPVAFVADVRGDVRLEGAGRAAFLAELAPGARLALGPGATAAVMFVVSGDEYLLKGPGEFTVAPDGVKAAAGAAPARRPSPVRASATSLVNTSRAATASLRMRGGVPPRPEAVGLRYPVDARVATLQPTLRWESPPGANLQVEVSGVEGREVFRGPATGASLRLPVRLEPGRAYAWRCVDGDRTVGTARFETLGPAAIAAADKARAAATTFTDRVALALLLQDLGAAQDAREIWIQLAAERPDLPELAVLAR